MQTQGGYGDECTTKRPSPSCIHSPASWIGYQRRTPQDVSGEATITPYLGHLYANSLLGTHIGSMAWPSQCAAFSPGTHANGFAAIACL